VVGFAHAAPANIVPLKEPSAPEAWPSDGQEPFSCPDGAVEAAVLQGVGGGIEEPFS
jgi:hypothetical protein